MNRSIVLCIVLAFGIGQSTAAADSVNGTEDLLDLLNSIRVEAGAEKCVIDPPARDTAADYAETIAATGRFSHIDAAGKDGAERYREKGGASLYAGEIIGIGNSLQEIVSAWHGSKDHYTVITDKGWTHFGAGMGMLDDGRPCVVVLFTRLLYRNIQIRPAENGTGIEVSGIFTGTGDPGVLINGESAEIRKDDAGSERYGGKEQSPFTIRFPREHAVYFLRFGILRAGHFTATETYIFDPESS